MGRRAVCLALLLLTLRLREGMSKEKPKKGVKTKNDHINLKVASQDSSEILFKIKRHNSLSKQIK